MRPLPLATPVVAALALATCYRGEPGPDVARAGDPLQTAGPACGRDDLAEPVIDLSPDGRLRTHFDGTLSGPPSNRQWTGAPVPRAIPRRLGTLELFLLDRADGGLLALYREPYGFGSCQLSDAANCAYEARHYDRRGQLRWSLPLGMLLSRPDHLEIQDIRLASGVLYLNEACQSYAREAGGACSSLVAIDPAAQRVLWRTPPLVSNGRFVLRGCYVVAGYGFTAELDRISLVDRATGAVRQQRLVSSAPEGYTLARPDQLHVRLYSGAVRRYGLDGVEGPSARLVELDGPEPGLGGATYGGAGYGGLGYGGLGYGGAGYGGLGYGGATYGQGGLIHRPIRHPIRRPRGF